MLLVVDRLADVAGLRRPEDHLHPADQIIARDKADLGIATVEGIVAMVAEPLRMRYGRPPGAISTYCGCCRAARDLSAPDRPRPGGAAAGCR
jgi:hypothetical protein